MRLGVGGGAAEGQEQQECFWLWVWPLSLMTGCNYVGVAPWIDGQEGRQVWQGGGGGVRI